MSIPTAFTDKEQITDLLTAEKHLASSYNAFLLESATPEVVHCLSALLRDTHDMQQQIFHTMQGRNWYQTPKAEDTKIAAAKQKFSAAVKR
ncbi:MAG: spore coat protein [Clostridia bacterium]|nr:spore coat protein [Clostridia bacterium]